MAPEKFKRLVHYIIAQCDDPSRLGATRLNKILWYVDTLAYRANGVSVTGESYVKRQYGPVPKHILATLRELEGEGKVLIRDKEYIGATTMRHFYSLKEADSEALSEHEKELVHTVIDAVCERTATEISDLTHDQVWEAANIGEEIPMFATLASGSGEITSEIQEWGDGVVARVAAEKNEAA